MTEPVVYLNGKIIPLSEAKLSVFDLGIVLGAAVTEMIRTFDHRPFRLPEHLNRLERSLRAVGFPREKTADEIKAIVEEVLQRNATLLPKGHDLGITIFVTAGTNLTYVGAAGAEEAKQPTLCVHTFPLPCELWVEKLRYGQHLVTPSVRQVPPETLDPKIKSRSRLHWYLADRQARLVDAKASALVLDGSGNIAETSTGNFFIVSDGTIRTPMKHTTLGGVSQQVVFELATNLGMNCVHEQLRVYDALNADEAFTSSTPYCLLPVTRLNGHSVGDGVPGPVFDALMGAWSALVGLDVRNQMLTVAAERTDSSETKGG